MVSIVVWKVVWGTTVAVVTKSFWLILVAQDNEVAEETFPLGGSKFPNMRKMISSTHLICGNIFFLQRQKLLRPLRPKYSDLTLVPFVAWYL